MGVAECDNVAAPKYLPEGGLGVGHALQVDQLRVAVVADDQLNLPLHLRLHGRVEHEKEHRPLDGAGDVLQAGAEDVIHHLNELLLTEEGLLTGALHPFVLHQVGIDKVAHIVGAQRLPVLVDDLAEVATGLLAIALHLLVGVVDQRHKTEQGKEVDGHGDGEQAEALLHQLNDAPELGVGGLEGHAHQQTAYHIADGAGEKGPNGDRLPIGLSEIIEKFAHLRLFGGKMREKTVRYGWLSAGRQGEGTYSDFVLQAVPSEGHAFGAQLAQDRVQKASLLLPQGAIGVDNACQRKVSE